jgi:hypothetical protein
MIESRAFLLGTYAKDYADAAHRIGISEQGVFLLTAYQGLVASGDIDEPQVTARDQLLRLADRIETAGASPSEHQQIAETIRYLSQFALERPVPVE